MELLPLRLVGSYALYRRDTIEGAKLGHDPLFAIVRVLLQLHQPGVSVPQHPEVWASPLENGASREWLDTGVAMLDGELVTHLCLS